MMIKIKYPETPQNPTAITDKSPVQEKKYSETCGNPTDRTDNPPSVSFGNPFSACISDSSFEDAISEHLEERAAIQEYDGGLTRELAEAEAQRTLRVYEYRLIDNPDSWLVLIAPGCGLSEATRTCHNKFGADRVLDVREYKTH